MKVEFAGFLLSLPEGWVDVTEDSGEDAPPTLTAGPEGLGALQFSIGEYESGDRPNVGLTDVVELLEDFASRQGLRASGPFRTREDPPLASGDFLDDDGFIRAWCVSDGRSVAFVTYTCGERSGDRFVAELGAADRIVRSIEFPAES